MVRMEIHAETIGMHSGIGTGAAFYVLPAVQNGFHCVLYHLCHRQCVRLHLRAMISGTDIAKGH